MSTTPHEETKGIEVTYPDYCRTFYASGFVLYSDPSVVTLTCLDRHDNAEVEICIPRHHLPLLIELLQKAPNGEPKP